MGKAGNESFPSPIFPPDQNIATFYAKGGVKEGVGGGSRPRGGMGRETAPYIAKFPLPNNPAVRD
jgi:hypothetical protein